MNQSLTLQLTLGLGFGFLVSCNEKSATTDESGTGPTIAVVNYPLAYFAERLAGDFATVLFEAPADEDPAFWKPSDDQIARIQKADLIFLNGADYAKWAATTTLPFEATVDTSAAFQSDFIEIKGSAKHSHGQDDEAHSHAGTAFTTWLDFNQAAAQAQAVADAIAEQWPDHKDAVLKKLETLRSDLEEIETGMREATAQLKGAPVLASHPVYQYWERANGLEVHALLWEPEMDLDGEAMAELADLQAAHPGAKYFLWEGEPSSGHIEKLEAAGLTSIVFSPCGNHPGTGDFLSVMRANLAALQALENQ